MAAADAGGVGDAVAPPAAAAGGGVLERLRAREAERAAVAASRQAVQASGVDARESVAAFAADFAARRGGAEAALRAAAAAPAGAAADAALDAAAARVGEAEEAAAAAAYFLPPYEMRQATAAAAALRAELVAARAALRPRAKFSFRAAAAAAADAAPPPAPAAAPAPPAPAPAPAPPAGGRVIAGLRGAALALSAEELGGRDVTLADLEDCTLLLAGPLPALFAHRLRRCRVLAGPVGGAALVEDAEACELHLAARQVRLHSAVDCDLYLHVASHPVVEHCHGVRVAPLSAGAAGGAAVLAAAGLGAEGRAGPWAEVQDFSWLRAAASPHWRVLPEAERRPPPEI